MKRTNVWGWMWVVCLLCALGVQAQRSEPVREGPERERPARPVASAPSLPGEDGGGTTLGTAPELSVFSVIKFGGVLKDTSGQPRTGITGITFALYREQEGGAPLWLETQNVQPNAQGRYVVLLGALQAEGLPQELFSTGEARWLGIEVQGEAEQPRILLVSVPYALKAAEAETLGGRTASEFVLTERLETELQEKAATIVRAEVKALTSSEEGGIQAITSGPSTFSGSNGSQILLVTQNGTGLAFKGVAQNRSAIQGIANATSGAVNAVRGDTVSTTGRGVFGLAKATSGATNGVRGTAKSTSGRGVFGLAKATSGFNRGVMGQTKSTQGIGVLGLAVATGGKTNGVRGVVKSAAGTAGVFINQAGGKILSGKGSGAEVFSVDGSGNFTLNGSSGGLIVQANATSPNLIGGFSGNSVSSGVVGASIGGGGESSFANQVTDDWGTVGGGRRNQAGDNAGTTDDRTFATVGGGAGNIASGNLATVGGGNNNEASGTLATVGGGISNIASGWRATVGGGRNNAASSTYATVGGGFGNSAAALKATIAGGGMTDDSDASTRNRVTDDFGTVGGGGNNQAGDNAGTTTDRTFATVGGGDSNTASGLFATVGGGFGNTAGDFAATVGGGNSNEASNFAATVPGGLSNTAQGWASFAAGRRAKADHAGAFVWGDSTNADVASNTDNQFIARATGGVTFFTDAGLTTGVTVGAGGGSWSSVSDRNLKENFAPVEGQSLLARLNQIPIETWNYKAQDDSIRHMGPMAQDFRAAFELGSDDKRISTVDADGVALAAIQALYRLSLEKEEELRKLKQENQEQVEQLEEQQAKMQEQQAQMREQQTQLQMLQAQFQRQQNQMRELQAVLAAVKTQLTRDREVQTAALASPE